METRYPILFGVRDPIIGNGFVAGVEASGRALMRKEPEGGFWVDGVYPGAVAAGGDSRGEALLRFRESYRSVLYDLAAAASSFDTFKAEVERFFWEETPGEAADWLDAAAALRADPSTAGDWLPLKTSYPEPTVTVVCLAMEDLQAEKNSDELVELATLADAAKVQAAKSSSPGCGRCLTPVPPVISERISSTIGGSTTRGALTPTSS